MHSSCSSCSSSSTASSGDSSTSGTFSTTTTPTSAIITLRSDGVIQSISRGCNELFGYDSCELVGKRITAIIPDPYGEDFGPLPSYLTSNEPGITAIAAAAAAGTPMAVDQKRTLEGRHKTGECFSLSVSVSELNIPNMPPLFILVAEQRETDEVFFTLSSSGHIWQVSRTCLSVFGYRDTELLRQPLALIVPPPSSYSPPCGSAAPYGVDSYVAPDRMPPPGGPYAVRNLFARHRDSDQWFPVSLKLRPIAGVPATAGCELYHCTVQPVADKEAVLTVDQCGFVQSCNAVAALVFGFSEPELCRQHISGLVPKLARWLDMSTPSTPPAHVADHTLATEMPTVIEMDVASTMSTAYADALSVPTRKRSASAPAAVEVPHEPPKKRRRMSICVDEANAVILDAVSTSGESSNAVAPPSPALRRRNTICGASPLAGAAVRTAPRRMSISGDMAAVGSVNAPVFDGTLAARHSDGSVFEAKVRLLKFQRTRGGGWMYGAAIVRPRTASALSSTTTAAVVPNAVGEVSPMSTMSDTAVPLPVALPIECRFSLKAVVGRGNQGVVRRATCLQTGREVAIKVLQKDLMEPKDYRRYLLEVDILKKLVHPHITRLYDVIEEADRVYIVTEFIGGGELHELVVAHQPGALPEPMAKRYFKQILSAVEYCHRHQVVHRDIKLKNILLDESGANVKVIDFGLSNFFAASGDQLRSTFCGTPAFAAPEMCLAQKYVGPEVDLWSLGVCLYAMVVGQLPFKNVVSLVNADYAPLPSQLSAEVQHVIKRLLVVDPKQRATVEELRSLPWMANEE